MIGETILHYKVLEKLGEGGMGVVYKAHDTILNRDVAIKFLPKQLSSKEEKERFTVEARAAAALNHPNIATIYAIEQADKQAFIVMEFIDGVELKEKISKGILKTNEALDIIKQVAEGLETAHEKGVIHRDIKSTNIMVTANSRIKIMDFGLAKIKGSDFVTRIGTTMGTVAYMSPEQAQGGSSDHRSDLWSMGVILYEMLAGKLPYTGEFEQAIIYSVINNEHESVSEINSEISFEVDSIINRLLAKDKTQRFQSATEFLSELKSVQSGSKEKPSAKEDKTIAVLPFENISSDKETDYFADGLTEELIINLSKIKEVSVLARTTTMQYKGTKKDIKTIGRELNIRYIIEGSVRKFQDDLRISVQFIDVAKGTQLWGETYKGKLADVFDFQEKVSKQVVDALMVKLTPMEKVVLEKRATVHAEAFDYYLKARDFLYRRTKSNVQVAIQLFQKAIEYDVRYAAAYAGLGEAYANLYQNFESKDVWLDKAIEASLKALTYDSTLSEAYSALALTYFYKKSNDEAFTAGKKAIELDSNSFTGHWILGRIYLRTDHYEEAAKLFVKVIELNSEFYSAYNDLCIVYKRLGQIEKSKGMLTKSISAVERYLLMHPDDARAHLFYAINLAEIGNTDKARAEAKKALDINPTDPLMQYNASCFYAQLGEKKLAVTSLKNAMSSGYQDYEWIKRDSDLESIRNEPGYIELMKGK